MATTYMRDVSIDDDLHDEKFSQSSEDRSSMDKDDTSYESDLDIAHLLKDSDRDLEAQPLPRDPEPQPEEYTIPTSKKLVYLGLYFLFNLGVTLSNKALLRHASLPWLLTFSHTASTSIGCFILLAAGQLKLTTLTTRENLTLVAFSVLFTLNIATSNVSLAAVSVPFHQVMRSTCPVITILIYRLFYSRSYSRATYLSMIPLIVGVGLATFGSYYFTPIGFALTFLGVLLASIKTVATNRLMTGSLKLSALEVLLRMSPLAALQCLVYAYFSGELSQLSGSFHSSSSAIVDDNNDMTSSPTGAAAVLPAFTALFLLGILCNAAMAFGLNIVSFQTNKVAGALTMSVCGNLKQCITILLGIVLFSVQMNWLNGSGILVALTGAAIYSKVELDRKKAASSEPSLKETELGPQR